jgi:AcrR family transcriptional regulator
MCPRKYDLGRRRASAEATRTRILEAARGVLGGKGDPALFSMDGVAERAGVSRMTVYNQFHSEGGLLEALADSLANKGGMQHLRDAFQEPRPDEAVRRFVRTFVDFWASDRLLLRRLRAFGVLFPALYRQVRDRDEWRREAARNLVMKIGVRPEGAEFSAKNPAVDLLTSMTSFETFDAMCSEDRPPADVARILSDSLLSQWGLSSGGRRPPSAAAHRPRSR